MYNIITKFKIVTVASAFGVTFNPKIKMPFKLVNFTGTSSPAILRNNIHKYGTSETMINEQAFHLQTHCIRVDFRAYLHHDHGDRWPTHDHQMCVFDISEKEIISCELVYKWMKCYIVCIIPIQLIR